MLESCPGYEFRTFDLRDVGCINALYYEEYGENYPYPLQPDRAALSALSTVAVCRGTVVGFARATPYAGNPKIFEFGGLIVQEAHRHRKVAKALTMRRMAAVVTAGATMVFSEPVCNRPDRASQFNLLDRGFTLCGILPFKYPEIKTSVLGHQPETVAMAYRLLDTPSRAPHPPLMVPEEIRNHLQVLTHRSQPRLSDSYALTGTMPDVITHKHLITRHQTGSMFVDVPANWAKSPSLIQSFLRQGYLFAGWLPSFGTTSYGQPFDYVTLYRPPLTDFDYSLIHVTDGLQALQRLMADEYERYTCPAGQHDLIGLHPVPPC